MADELKLYCLVVNERRTFSVLVSRNGMVEDLQKAIRPQTGAFQVIDTNLLKLYKVSSAIPYTQFPHC
jgi:hypothetical protein